MSTTAGVWPAAEAAAQRSDSGVVDELNSSSAPGCIGVNEPAIVGAFGENAEPHSTVPNVCVAIDFDAKPTDSPAISSALATITPAISDIPRVLIRAVCTR